MFHNYLKIIWRNIYRQPAYTILNLSCLSLGIAAALIILLYLDFELNFDQFHEQKDRIYRIETKAIHTHKKVMNVNWDRTSAPLGPYIQQDFPEVESYTRFYRFFHNESVNLTIGDKIIAEDEIMVADASALTIFSFDFMYGAAETALTEPNQIILTESLAQRIFGDINPVGKIIDCELTHILPDVNPAYSLIVSGVYRDFPRNSHLFSQAFISAATDPRLMDYEIGRFSFYSYVLLKAGIEPNQLVEKLPSIYEKYIDPEQEPILKYAVHELIPLAKIHLSETGGYTYLYIFAAVGLLLLLIAMISYVNLVTAQASKRALEIGIRKVVGGNRRQLITQFLGESLAFTLLALVLAILFVFSIIPLLNELLALQLMTQQLAQPQVIIGMLGILLTLGILGGSYPAFFLSAFQPITILKDKMVKGTSLRRALVGIQFVVVLIVLISTGMIYEQLNFLRKKDLGFNREQIVLLNFSSEADLQKMTALKETIKESPLIDAVGTASFLPGVGMGRRPLSADNGTSRESQFVNFGRIDYDFLETMDIKLIAGRNFSIAHPSDEEENLLVNEAMVKSFGLKNPIGEKVRYGDAGNPNFKTIIGVVKDFHQSTLHQPIAPQMFLLNPFNYEIVVKIDGDVSKGMVHLEKAWGTIFPTAVFNYRFLDDALQRAYVTDQTRGNIFVLFSILTIVITFLGLFGLVAYIAQQRVKEIGIRKVLGASLNNIVWLIAKDFLWLVLLAAIPAFLIAYYFIDIWLQDFAFRTTINPLIFGLVLVVLLSLTFLVTSLHAIKTALLNPSRTLKSE